MLVMAVTSNKPNVAERERVTCNYEEAIDSLIVLKLLVVSNCLETRFFPEFLKVTYREDNYLAISLNCSSFTRDVHFSDIF